MAKRGPKKQNAALDATQKKAKERDKKRAERGRKRDECAQEDPVVGRYLRMQDGLAAEKKALLALETQAKQNAPIAEPGSLKRKSNDKKSKKTTRATETNAAKAARLARDSLWKKISRQNELKEVNVARLASQRKRQSDARDAESDDERAIRLAKKRKLQSDAREAESAEDTAIRLANQKKLQSDARDTESDDERAIRLAKKRKLQSDARDGESDEETAIRLAKQKKLQSHTRDTESDEETAIRLAKQKKLQSDARDSESDEETASRLAAMKDKRRSSIAIELPVDKTTRQVVERKRKSSGRLADTLLRKVMRRSCAGNENGDTSTETVSPSNENEVDSNNTDCGSMDSAFEELDPSTLTRQFFGDAANDFHAKLGTLENVFCPNCKERFPDIKLNSKTGVCAKCTKNKDKYSQRNNMDPGVIPEELKGLTTIECILISRVVQTMSVYRLPHGQYGYSGNVINIPQDVESVASILPRLPTDLKVMVLQKSGQNGSCKEFRVRRDKVHSALKWLCRYNIHYKDEVSISEEHLSQLPENGELNIPDIIETENTEDEDNAQTDHESEPPDELDEFLSVYGVEPTEISSPDCFQSSFIPVVLETRTERSRKEDEVDQRLGSDPDKPLLWPKLDASNPVNEFDTIGYVVQAFPELFGLINHEAGAADAHESARSLAPVTLLEYFQHMLRYDDSRFARHNRFRYFALNTILRHRAMAQGRVFVKQNPDEARMTVEELQNLAKDQKTELLNKISRYGSSLPGSSQYWGARRQELLQFIKFKKKLPTVFFTLSSADMQWPDLHRLLPNYPSRSAAVIENPLMCVWFFVTRVKFIIETVFKKDLNFTDLWYKFEFQHRGSIHVHGVAYDDNAPDVCEIPNLVVNKDHDGIRLIIKYIDELITTVNPGFDMAGMGDLPQFLKNPASTPYFQVKPANKDLDYLGLVLYCHTHKCRRGYCQKDSQSGPIKCRFHFPFELVPESRIDIVEDAKTAVKTVKFISKRNDPNLNQHNRRVASTFRSNTDMQPVVDRRRLIGYCTKYVCKKEGRSDSMKLLSNEALSMTNPQDPVRQIAQRTLIKAVGDRDYSAQETMHVITGTQQFGCSRTFVTLYLTGDRELTQEGGKPILVSTLVDKYCTKRSLAHEHMSMTEFYSRHYFGASDRIVDRKKTAVIVPKGLQKVDSESPLFEQYALKYLMLHKPFRRVSDLLGDDTSTYTEAYKLLMSDVQESAESFDLEDDVANEQRQQAPSGEDDRTDMISDRLPAEFADLLTLNPEFAANYNEGIDNTDWLKPYRDNVDLYETVKQFQDSIAHRLEDDTIDVDPALLNQNQRNAYDEVLLHVNSDNKDDACQPLRMIITGTAGTGKSFLISCLKKLLGSKCLLIAPTGVAACNVKGQTINSALRIPIVSPNNFTELRGPGLESIQQKLVDIEYVIIEEMSMIGLSKMRMIDSRLRQIFPAQSQEIFGGRSFILIGDFGQLPPVGDTVLYSRKPRDEFQLGGALVYRSVTSCTVLKCSVRQENDLQFCDVLQRQRNGTLTDNDFEVLKSRFFKGHWNRNNSVFKEAVHLYARRADANAHNVEELGKLNTPVVPVHADHTGGNTAKKASSDDACGLDAFMLIAKGAKIMVTANLNTDAGLCNGTQGIVVEIIYKDRGPPSLPHCVLCQLPSYIGPSFLPDKPNIFPVTPITRRFSKAGIDCTRTMLPLSLAHAMTIHKAQGLTLPKVFLDIGKAEFATGLSFVGMSRVRCLNDILMKPFGKHRLLNLDKSGKSINKTAKGISMLRDEDARLEKLAAGTLTSESDISLTGTAVPHSLPSSADTSSENLLQVADVIEHQPAVDTGVVQFLQQTQVIPPNSRTIAFRTLTEADRISICASAAIKYSPSPLVQYGPDQLEISCFQDPSSIRNVRGDGSCFYHAISLAISNSANFDSELRMLLSNYVLQYPHVITSAAGASMTQEVVEDILSTGVEGHASEGVIRAMAFALNTSIYVYLRNDRYEWMGYHPNDKPTERAIYIFSCNMSGQKAIEVAPDHFTLVTHV